MVVSPKIGSKLLGEGVDFTNPVKMLPMIQGGRLIPYNTVNTQGGLLLAKRFENVHIGRRKSSCMIAFAPQNFGEGETYDALMGGSLWDG
jgi:hypothetical protein